MLEELGANHLGGGDFGFLVWAPLRERVALKILSPDERTVPMEKADRGYFEKVVTGLGPDGGYLYELDGKTQRPDPASRFQPGGVHGPSALYAHDAFTWTDQGWHNIPLEDYIIYELHVGAFTPGGTFDGVVSMLPYLKELGVNAVELMPVAQFPGERNWGYDGAYPFAVQSSYGGPEGLKRLVNECHMSGLAVVLDVVYNHLGPEGNYLRDFGPYFTDRYRGPWGDALNFDGPRSDEVRRFFIENALYWAGHFHMDALRIDAVHGIFDMGAKHFLAELVEEVSGKAPRKVYLIPESDLNDARLLNPPGMGGHGLDAQWNDDFHHALRTLLTGERDGYYQDFGELGHMAKALREGFVYSGQYSRFRDRRHGSPTFHIHPRRFVVFSQNHDQVGNRMRGDRLSRSLSMEKLKLAASMVILSPSIPLLFMGEEYGEKAPFQYFVSHSDPELVRAVREGRRREFASFKWEGEVPDPQEPAAFERSKINPGLRKQEDHVVLYEFYRELIRLRNKLPSLRNPGREETEVAALEDEKVITVLISHGGETVLLMASFNDAAVEVHTPDGGEWHRLLDSSLFGISGTAGPGSDRIKGPVRLNPYSFSAYRREV
jgi:maltooligosyltrehalose trehalohydrolase